MCRFFSVPAITLAPERFFGEPAVALCGVRLSNNDVPWHKQRGQRAIKAPQRNLASVTQGRCEHVPPANDCGLADLIAAQRPE